MMSGKLSTAIKMLLLDARDAMPEIKVSVEASPAALKTKSKKN